jgi:hypothetical protein
MEVPQPKPAQPEAQPPPDLEIEPATSPAEADRARELIREQHWDDLRSDS